MGKKASGFDWRNYIFRIIAGFLIVVAATSLLLFLIACIVYFPPRGIDSQLLSLGLYGDFFGGIIGAIMSVASLGVTIYLAIILHRIERENTEASIETQRRVAVMQMKFQEFTNYRTICDLCLEKIALMGNKREQARTGCLIMESQTQRLIMIFPDLKNLISVDLADLHKALDSATDITYSFKPGDSPTINEVARKLNEVSMAYFMILGKLGEWVKE